MGRCKEREYGYTTQGIAATFQGFKFNSAMVQWSQMDPLMS